MQNLINEQVIKYLYKAKKQHKFGQRLQMHFSGKARQNLELFKNFPHILELPIKLF